MLGIGAFIENLVIAAGTFGYEVDINLIAKDSLDTDIADIRLKKGEPLEFSLEKLKQRRTLRSEYSDQEIKTEDLKFITKHETKSCTLTDAPAPHAFYFISNLTQGKYLQEETIAANRALAFRDSAQEELANWIRWSNKKAKQFLNGLTTESMEIKGP